MNKPLLKHIIALIEAEPKRIWMGTWFARGVLKEYMPPCGTVACIAGWALILSERKPNESFSVVRDRCRKTVIDPQARGATALGITERQSERLFYHTSWPRRFARPYGKSYENAEQRSRVVVRRIRHFMRTGK